MISLWNKTFSEKKTVTTQPHCNGKVFRLFYEKIFITLSHLFLLGLFSVLWWLSFSAEGIKKLLNGLVLLPLLIALGFQRGKFEILWLCIFLASHSKFDVLGLLMDYHLVDRHSDSRLFECKMKSVLSLLCCCCLNNFKKRFKFFSFHFPKTVQKWRKVFISQILMLNCSILYKTILKTWSRF